MRIIGFLRGLYPDVPVTLHAGELAEGLVPPEGLRFHVREAVEVAGARRVGHGVDVLLENDSLEYAFVEGGSLWADYDALTPVDACAPRAGGLEGARCAAWVAGNTKARLERSLELETAAFEARVAEGGWPILR